jgi:hypothetical protein
MGDNEARKIYADPMTAVAIPTLQALITALFSGMFASTTTYLLRSPSFLEWGIGAAALTGLFAWYGSLGWWKARLFEIEHPQLDFSATEIEPTKFEITMNEGRTLVFEDLPATPEQLAKIARLVSTGATVSQGNMKSVFGGSREKFQAFQSRLIERGWGRWRNPHAPTQGIELTAKGTALFRGIHAQNEQNHAGNARARTRTQDIQKTSIDYQDLLQ